VLLISSHCAIEKWILLCETLDSESLNSESVTQSDWLTIQCSLNTVHTISDTNVDVFHFAIVRLSLTYFRSLQTLGLQVLQHSHYDSQSHRFCICMLFSVHCLAKKPDSQWVTTYDYDSSPHQKFLDPRLLHTYMHAYVHTVHTYNSDQFTIHFLCVAVIKQC